MGKDICQFNFYAFFFLHWWKTKTKDLSGLFFLYCSEKKTHQQILFITCENASHPWVIVNQFHAWTGNRVNRNRRKKISNENGIKLFHAKSLEKLIGSNDKKYKENCRGFFSHYIPEIIAIFHLLHSQKKIKTANIYCNNKHIHFDLNEERKCHLGKQVIVPCTICLKKYLEFFEKIS